MDKRIQTLTNGMSNVRVLDIKDQEHLLRAINSLPPKAAKLQGHHAPFNAKGDLVQIHSSELQRNTRHLSRALTVKIIKTEYKNGALLTCVDVEGPEDETILVWLLLLRPFGYELRPGMTLYACKPYFARCPPGEAAVCIHHPSDCQIMTEALTEDEGMPRSELEIGRAHV